MVKLISSENNGSLIMTNNNNNNKKMLDIGRTVTNALKRAREENRLVIGLSAAVKELSATNNGEQDVIFCLLAPPQIGDSATHMNTILLEAFCYENDIYTIKVDSAEKLSRILGTTKLESCVLIQKPWIDPTTSPPQTPPPISSKGFHGDEDSEDEGVHSDDENNNITNQQQQHQQQQDEFTANEEILVDHCEEFWDVPQQPIIVLPE